MTPAGTIPVAPNPEMDSAVLAEAFRFGKRSLAQYIDNLETYFVSREPQVAAFIPEADRFERLRADAAGLERRWPEPGKRPALYGIPVGVKDIFQAAGFVTRAGSRLPPEELQGSESQVVTRLKEAGALIMGKTVTTEFAYFGPGPTRNPHNPEHTPGGSSSGSAAAVGAGLCPITVGTQTIGSVVRPAAYCGCVGFKPSYDRLSRNGVIPLSPSLDHVGFFANSVGGIQLVMGAACPDWTVQPVTARPTLGIPVGPYLERAGSEALAHFSDICRHLETAGYIIRDIHVMDDFAEIRDRHYLITAAEAARVHAKWFGPYKSAYHIKTIELLERGNSIPDAALVDALTAKAKFGEAAAAAMMASEVDAWISPAAPGTAPMGLESTGDPVMNLPWSQAGFPAITLPSGRGQNGLPLGLQITGRRGADEILLEWAREVERVMRGVHPK